MSARSASQSVGPDSVPESGWARRLNQFSFHLVLAAAALAAGMVFWFRTPAEDESLEPVASKLRLEDIPFDGRQAYEYLKELCALGPRPSGTPAMERQQARLVEHFEKLGGRVTRQEFRAVHPGNGAAVTMTNLIVEWKPQATERILLCAHYDTRPFPDRDPVDRRGTFIGANDGASGTALLMELGRHMPRLEGALGVDFVLFDGEEFVFPSGRSELGEYFLGSEHFARSYRDQKPRAYRYRQGVLLDMVGDADLQLFQEVNSVRWRDTRPLVQDLWRTALKLGVSEFVARSKHELRDDHLPLRNTGGIPACDIIDFDYPHWHTRDDTPDKCSALSLAKVGWVVHTWLQQQK